MTIEKAIPEGQPGNPLEGPYLTPGQLDKQEQIRERNWFFDQIYAHWGPFDPRRRQAMQVFEKTTSAIERDGATDRWRDMRVLVGRLGQENLDVTDLCDCLFLPLLHASLAISFIETGRVSVQLLQQGEGRLPQDELASARSCFVQCGFAERDCAAQPDGETIYTFERRLEPRKLLE